MDSDQSLGNSLLPELSSRTRCSKDPVATSFGHLQARSEVQVEKRVPKLPKTASARI